MPEIVDRRPFKFGVKSAQADIFYATFSIFRMYWNWWSRYGNIFKDILGQTILQNIK